MQYRHLIIMTLSQNVMCIMRVIRGFARNDDIFMIGMTKITLKASLKKHTDFGRTSEVFFRYFVFITQ